MELQRIPKIAKYLSVVFLFAWIGRSTVWMFLPVYFENHMSVFWVGIATSLVSAIPLLFDIPVGNLVQRAGEKIIIFIGLVIAIFPPLLYYLAVPAALIAGKAIEGFAKVFIWNGGWSLSLRSADDDVESETVSVFLLGTNLGIILGPILGGYLIASHGFDLAFGIWVFTSTLAVLVYLAYIGIDHDRSMVDSVEEVMHRETYHDEIHDIRENWSELKFPFSLIFLYSIIFSFYWMAIPLLLEKVSGDFAVMGVIFGVAAMPKAFQFIFGEIADRFGKARTLAALAILLTPVLISMNFVSSTVLIGALFFVARTLSSGMSPAIHAIFDSSCPDELEGELTGFLEFFKHSGQTIGPIMAGTIATIWSINASFLAAAGISALIVLLTLVGLRGN